MRRTDSLLAKELGVKEVIMSKFAKDTRATVIPCLRYRNAPAAIEWLCKTFGFEKQLVVPNEDGTIVHAQLTFGNGMIMLGSVLKVETEFGRLMKQPDEIGGAETQSAYVVVSDADVAYQRAKAAGAENRDRDQRRGLRWPGLQLPRSGRPFVELRHLRSMVTPSDALLRARRKRRAGECKRWARCTQREEDRIGKSIIDPGAVGAVGRTR